MDITPEQAALIRAIRRGRRIRFIALGIVFALPIVYGIYRIVKGFRDRAKAEAEIAAQFELTDGERAELDRIARDAPDTIQTASAAWKRVATREALAKIDGGEARCGRRIDGSVVQVAAGAPVPDVDPDLRFAATEVEALTTALAADDVNTDSLRRARELLPATTVVFLVDTAVSSAAGGDTYMPGGLAGNAYLFDVQTGRIVCAAPVVAQNSAEIKVEYQYDPNSPIDQTIREGQAARTELARDLERNLRARIQGELHAVP